MEFAHVCDILLNLNDQFLGAGERFRVADFLEKIKRKGFSIQAAGKAEQMRLDLARVLAKRQVWSEVGGGGPGFALVERAHGINAVAWQQSRDLVQIRRRVAERGAAFLPRPDDARDAIGPAE